MSGRPGGEGKGSRGVLGVLSTGLTVGEGGLVRIMRTFGGLPVQLFHQKVSHAWKNSPQG